MKIVRSFPKEIPSGRSYVVDGIDRLIIENYRYDALADLGDDVLLLEWDIAAGEHDLAMFAEAAAHQPADVLVAPYRLYQSNHTTRGLRETVWVHGLWPDYRRVKTGDPFCNLFGFGMTYLPRRHILGYLEARDQARDGHQWGFSDSSFSGWHYRCVKQWVPIAWGIQPVHLNYGRE
ncbi:MAG TPA: hypothetical protein VIQ30_19250 [Pseudonocardia sp.]